MSETESTTYVDTPQSVCSFGIAHGDITPPSGIYCRMWGAAAHDRATGVHRPLRATAMIFRERGDAATPDSDHVLVLLDHCFLWANDMSALLDGIVETTGLARDSVVVSFSHTHAAGLLDSGRVSLPGGDLIPRYLRQLTETVATLVARARDAMQYTTVTYGTGRCSLAAHRDYWDAPARRFVCGFNPDGEADDTLLVTRMTGGDGRTIATVVNYACHPTTLGWENSLISPDYPGALRELIEASTGAPCAFVQGACGDLGPKEGYAGEVELADRHGRQLAHAALAVLESLPPPRTRFEYTGHVVSGATLGTWAHAPLPQARRGPVSRWRVRRWKLELDYRAGLPRRQDVEAERARWVEEERSAQGVGDAEGARNARALVERTTRELSRLDQLPQGGAYPYEITLLGLGDAFWVAVQGEPYSVLQRALRARFPGVPIVVAALSGSSWISYLPPKELYGRDIYQAKIAVVAPGSLERVIEAVGAAIESSLESRQSTVDR